MSWCTEFASWVFSETWGPIVDTPPDAIPKAGPGENIGIFEFRTWAEATGRLMSFEPEGPTPAEWADLATSVQAGDMVARAACLDVNSWENTICDEWDAHAMVVVAWVNEDETIIGPDAFVPESECNILLEISGNTGAAAVESLRRVRIRQSVVCRAPDADGEDPEGCSCDIRLWAPNDEAFVPPGEEYVGTFVPEGGYFADMPDE